jgi:hypothetical protein
MFLNLFFEILIFLFAIFANSGIIYLFTIYHFYTKNLSIFTNSSEKGIRPITILIGFYSKALLNVKKESNFINFERNEGIMVHNPDLIELNTVEQNRIFIDPVAVNNNILEETEVDIVQNQNTIPSELTEGITSLDSMTILDIETHDLWLDKVMELHDLPLNTAESVFRQVKLEELNILYSQDIIHYGVSQEDLRLLIESIPVTDLLQSDINHFILTMMSYLPL